MEVDMPPPLPAFASRRDGRIEVRRDPVKLTFTLPGLRTADGHELSAYITATARLVDRPADVQLFAEQFLAGRDNVSGDEVKWHFASPLNASAREFAARHDIDACFRQRAAFEMLLLQRCESVGFGCGVEFLAPLSVLLESETLAAQQVREQAYQRQLDDLEHAARVSEKLSALGPTHRLPVSEQAALLPALLAAAAPTRVLLTAGPNVVVVEPDGRLQAIAMPEAIGPLRCVRKIENGYAVGGTGGVALLDADFASPSVFTGAATSGRGFNSVALQAVPAEVVATHGELGLVVWPASENATPRTIPMPGVARLLTPVGNHLIAAADGAVMVYEGQIVRPIDENGSTVIAVGQVNDTCFTVRQDGSMHLLDAQTLHRVGQCQLPSGIQVVTGVPIEGLKAILLAESTGNLRCMTLTGETLATFAASPGGVRMLTMAGGQPAGVSADRTSLLLWNPAVPGEPPRTMNVLARTGHHVTDIIAG